MSTEAQRRASRNYQRRQRKKAAFRKKERERGARYRKTETGQRSKERRASIAVTSHKNTQAGESYLAFRICSARNVDRPAITWMDSHGNLHREIELSAEELIRRYEKQQKKKGRSPCP